MSSNGNNTTKTQRSDKKATVEFNTDKNSEASFHSLSSDPESSPKKLSISKKHYGEPKKTSIIENLQEESTERKIRFGSDDLSKIEPQISDDVLPEYKTSSKECEQFLRIEDFAETFIDDILDEAKVKCKGYRKETSIKFIEGIEYSKEDSASVLNEDQYICVFTWPRIQQFTTTLAEIKISEYLSYSKFDEDWKYCVFFLNSETNSVCDSYHYEAIFSIPCKQYPIPQATASIYFTFEVSRVKPPECLVDVYFRFEGQRLIQYPTKFLNPEERLFNIIDAKINFFKTVTF